MDNNLLLEEYNVKQAFAPVDLNTAAVTGERIGLKKGHKVAILVSLGASVGATVQLTLRQHNAASAGTSKDLSVANVYYVKAGAATSFTKVEPTVAAAMYDLSATFAADGGVVCFEVLAEDLDVNGDFSHISVDVADSAAAKVGAGIYVLRDCVQFPAYAETI